MSKPIIGITLDEEEKKTYSKFPWYAARKNYSESVERAGGICVFLPSNINAVNQYLKIIHGLVVTGGDFDIDPKIYGNNSSGARILKNQRTNFEIAITKKFLKSSKPILGICGGAQLLNVVCGGTLIQDIKKNNLFPINHEQKNPRNETSHKIEIISKTLLAKINKKKFSKVNSAHHQAIKDIGKNIIISSYAPDGIIESIEHKHHKWCIGVQWHPEFLITKEDKNLIKNFIKNTKR